MCPHCRAFITTGDKTCPYCGEKVGPRAVEVRDAGALLGGLIPHARLVTSLILLINSGLFLATLLYAREAGEGRALLAFGGKYGPALTLGHQWWRLVTAGFLHGGWLHILMNSWVLLDLGAEVETTYGKARMMVIYFVATVAGFYVSWCHSPELSVGSSAGITGLLGAMVALGVRNRTSMGVAIRNHYLRWTGYILVIGLVVQGVDNFAHIGGFAAGFVVAYLARDPIHSKASTEMLWSTVAGLCTVATALCFFEMYVNFTGRF